MLFFFPVGSLIGKLTSDSGVYPICFYKVGVFCCLVCCVYYYFYIVCWHFWLVRSFLWNDVVYYFYWYFDYYGFAVWISYLDFGCWISWFACVRFAIFFRSLSLFRLVVVLFLGLECLLLTLLVLVSYLVELLYLLAFTAGVRS